LPEHKIHQLLDRILFGKPLPHVHRFIDEPFKVLKSRHRILRHDLTTCLFLGVIFGPKAFGSALMHILADKAESRFKRRRKNGRRRKKKKI